MCLKGQNKSTIKKKKKNRERDEKLAQNKEREHKQYLQHYKSPLLQLMSVFRIKQKEREEETEGKWHHWERLQFENSY